MSDFTRKVVNTNLHSSMDRLKQTRSLPAISQSFNLHSSMDRLKLCKKEKEAEGNVIYIPVWID